MAPASTMADFEAHEARYGHPSAELPLRIREAYLLEGMAAPTLTQKLVLHTPPEAGHCAHCGVETRVDQHLRAYAVAGFEDAHGPNGELLRMLVTHCDEHINSDHCSRDEVTPGSGVSVGSGGYCEAIPSEVALGISFFPGAKYLGKFLGFALSAGGLWLATQLAIQTSQGQQLATLQGTANQGIAIQDATANHGYNAGLIRVYAGAAPATANAAETGTKGIEWILPATAFGAASAAIPSVATMNAVSNVNAVASITAGYARLTTGTTGSGFPTLEDGTLSTTQRRIMFSVGTSGADMNFNTLAISSGGACSLTSFTVTHGA